VRNPARETGRAAGPAFDLSAAKLWRPRARPGSVRRSSLVERLRQGASRAVVSVVAPAGYAKTTLLAQWAEQNGQAFVVQGRAPAVQLALSSRRWKNWIVACTAAGLIPTAVFGSTASSPSGRAR